MICCDRPRDSSSALITQMLQPRVSKEEDAEKVSTEQVENVLEDAQTRVLRRAIVTKRLKKASLTSLKKWE